MSQTKNMSQTLKTANELVLSFQLKGGLYPLTALQLLGTDLSTFEVQLTTKIQQAPKFFLNAPIVIDLQKINHTEHDIDFTELLNILRLKKLMPVGVKGGRAEQQAAALKAGLPILPEDSRDLLKSDHHTNSANTTINNTSAASNNAKKTTETQSSTTELKANNTKVITEPVRSGQQIYARGGDLIVLAPVSHGAELLADGHIHIYSPLRGRALAGVTGNESARIFCQSLEAELISIAGEYKISEDIDQSFWRLGVEIYLDAGRLHLRPL